MPKKKKVGKERLDKFYHLAKEQGFRSRAAFKLIQLNKKFDFLSRAERILDLCAAPGAYKGNIFRSRKKEKIVGVDLVPIRPVRHCQSFQEDITTGKCRQTLKKTFKNEKVDVVLNDGAPNVGGQWAKDAYSQSELVLYAVALAVEFLRPGGTFVTKVFRSSDYNTLLWVFNQLFKSVTATKPQASRNTSAEIFVVCEGYLAPKKVDPKLLDPKFVFAEVENTAVKKVDVLRDKPAKRNREGYEEGNYLLFKKADASEYIHTSHPHNVLADNHQIVFDSEESKMYLSHAATTQEILNLCEDLKVLGKREFKDLLNWRIKIRKYLEQLKEEGEEEGDEEKKEEEKDESEEVETEEEEENETSESETEELDTTLRGIQERMEKKKKKQQKKERLKLARLRQRVDTSLQANEDFLDTLEDGSLFTLKNVPDSENLERALAGIEPTDVVGSDEEEQEGENIRTVGDVEQLEEDVDHMYEEYMARKGKKALRGSSAMNEEEEERKRAAKFYSKYSQENENPLLVDLGVQKDSISRTAKQWFSQPLFEEMDVEINDTSKKRGRENEEEEEEEFGGFSAKKRKVDENGSDIKKKEKSLRHDSKSLDSDSDSDSEQSDSEADSEYNDVFTSKPRNDFENDTFEEVPKEEIPEDLLDPEERTKILSLGTEMLRKKRRNEIIDASFNRYAFGEEELPRWFAEDEKKHNKPQLPVSKETMQKIKERFREIDERPIKKVVEAKARKRRKAMKQLQKLQKKTNQLMEGSEASINDKLKSIESLMNAKNKAKKQAKSTKKKNNLDRRLKKDKRGMEAADKRQKKNMKVRNKKKRGL